MKAQGKRRLLSEEDRVLWSSVARTVRPLPGKEALFVEEVEAKASEPMKWIASPAIPPMEALKQRQELHRPASIDRPTRRKLARGRIGLDATLDLHDLTQAQAYAAMLGFLRDAQARGLRHILVVTGKGSSAGSGVLREAVPHWLATEPFRPFVSSFDLAARTHGGEGAIYLKLRRRKEVI